MVKIINFLVFVFTIPGSIDIKKQLTDDMGGRLALWYHIYGYGWRYGIISTVMVGVMVSYLRLWLALWYHIYGYGWRYGIISTVPFEQQKIYRQIILFLRIYYYLSISSTGLPCHREQSIVLMSMLRDSQNIHCRSIFAKICSFFLTSDTIIFYAYIYIFILYFFL